MEKGSHNCLQNNQVNATICQETDCKCDLSVVSDLKTARMPNYWGNSKDVLIHLLHRAKPLWT